MSKYQTNNHQQLELLEREVPAKQPAKRINIVSLKLVRESSVLYRERQIKSPEDAYKLLKPFLVEADREKFVVVCLDTKNQPTAINICHVGSLNAGRERCLSPVERCRRLIETESWLRACALRSEK